MARFVVHEVAADVVVRVTHAMPKLPAAVDREVERQWQAASERVAAGGAGRMFNGRVFSADAITPRLVTGHLTEYRRVVAQIEQSELFAELGVRSFAVCGMLRCAGGVVVGRRHRAAIYQPGMWQLAPAGSVDMGVRDGRRYDRSAPSVARRIAGGSWGFRLERWARRGRSALSSTPAAMCRISACRWSQG